MTLTQVVTCMQEGGDEVVYFMADIYMDGKKDRKAYDEYIREVKPIVMRYHGKYLARTEKVVYLSEERKPQRVILIEFPTMAHMNACFSCDEYKQIMEKRENCVDGRAIVVEGGEEL